MIYSAASIVLMWILVFATPLGLSARRLNEYIKYYEPVSYDEDLVHQNHLRAKRSTLDPVVRIDFRSHGRSFNLRLKRDTTVFARDCVLETPQGKIDFDTSHIYDGHLWGIPETKVHGSIRDGIFEGKIHMPQATYYVERAIKYFKNHSKPFHSVIYSANDVEDPFEEQREGMFSGCGVTEEVMQWMQDVGTSYVQDDEISPKTKTEEELNSLQRNSQEKATKNKEAPSDKGQRQKRFVSLEAQPHNIYARDLQWRNPLQQEPSIPLQRACSLYIQTDTFLWDHIKTYEKSDTKAREEITSLIAQHIKAVNHIYEDTNFAGFLGIKFIVQRIKINDTSACDSDYKRFTNPFCSPNIDVSNFLNLNSQFNHDDFCLAYIFTYRDFSGGTLGLAWVASASGASGGICEKYKSYTENIGGRQVQTKRSLNTGIITFVNYNSRVPPKVSELTLAHEIGHNFGSPHDYPLECRPGGSQGNFIMYASATSGDRPNNNKFSHCSIRNITGVLRAVYRNEGKENCFLEDDGAFCGNKIVEESEECDCGFDEKECTEKCCYPKEMELSSVFGKNAKPCTLRPGAYCSPSAGPCCNDTCSFENRNKRCRGDSDCNHASYCSGASPGCPTPRPKANRTECNEGTQVCWSGECIGSICEKYDMEECFLTKEKGAKPEQMCEVACQKKGRPDTCQSTYGMNDPNISGIRLRPGHPCNDFHGYCDVFQKCRDVDAEGPLARLKNLLFNQKTLMSIKQWVTTYWWAVMLMLVGLSIFMGIFIKCCAVHTPSSNPRKPPALRITDTLRRPADTLRRKRHRPNPQSAPTGPPPPYSGPRPTAPPAPSAAGPSHGYGEGRGHYNRKEKQFTVPPSAQKTKIKTEESPYAPAYPDRGSAMEMRGKPRA